MSGKSCVVVLVGRHTAGRKWVDHEIKKGWGDGKGLLGVYIHGLADMNGKTTGKGTNPFSGFTVGKKKGKLNLVAPVHDPSGLTTKATYKTIEDNIEDWVEESNRNPQKLSPGDEAILRLSWRSSTRPGSSRLTYSPMEWSTEEPTHLSSTNHAAGEEPGRSSTASPIEDRLASPIRRSPSRSARGTR